MIKKICVLIVMVLNITACTGENTVEVNGRVAMKGTGMHTYIVIEDTKTKKIVKVANHEAFDLMQHQNEIMTLKVKLVKEAIGVGFPAVVEVLEVK